MQGTKSVFITRLTDVDLTDKEGVGSIRQEGNKWYKYVKVLNETATVAGAAGSLVSYDAATGYTTNTVVIDQTDADATTPFGAGALLATVTGTAGTAYYCWMQVKGNIVLDTAVTSAAAGKQFIMSATDKTGTVATNGVAHAMGVSYNTTTGVVLDCPL
jgi:hypothetical protein